MNGFIEKRILSCKTLPSMPGIAAKLLDLCQDESVDLRKVAELASMDPALSARMLKLVNSSLYGLRFRVNTVHQAVTLLGLVATRGLVLSVSLVPSLARKDTVCFDYDVYWKRSLIAAQAAPAIGRWLHVTHQEELFVAGLLQDLGMLVLGEALPEIYGPIVKESDGDHRRLVALEHRHLDTDHAEVGVWLARRWNLPEIVVQGMAGSHDPYQVDPELSPTIRCVALSSLMADIWVGKDTAGLYRRARAATKAMSILDDGAFHAIVEEISRGLPELAELMGMDLGKLDGLERALDLEDEVVVPVKVGEAVIEHRLTPVPTMGS